MLMDLDGTSGLLILRLLIMVSHFPFEHCSEAFVLKTLAQFCNVLMKFWRDLRFAAVPFSDKSNGCVIWDFPRRQTLCFHAFFWTCAQLRVLKKPPQKKQAFGQTLPPQCTPTPPPTPIWRHQPYYVVNYAFCYFPKAPFTTMLLLVFFGCWE